jgi:hypothetical protein
MPTPPTKPTSPPVETDSRFPGGEWVGHWLQRPKVKGAMELILTFREGRIEGKGRDLAGEFVMSGHYDLPSGKVGVQKRYIGQHTLRYDGWAEDGKGIWGVWKIESTRDKGGWHIWPRGMADPTGERLAAAVAVPVEETFVEYPCRCAFRAVRQPS